MPACLPPRQPAPHAGRYHRPGDGWPLYAALDRDTMWAEWAAGTGGAVRPEDDRRWVCGLEVDLAVLDLRDAGTRRALEVDLEELTAAWSLDAPNLAAARLARAAAELGVDGLIVPSAARTGGWNLVVLPPAFDRVRLAERRRMTPRPVESHDRVSG